MRTLNIRNGVCYAYIAYEVGMNINLDWASNLITETKERSTIRHKRRSPRYFEFNPVPLRITSSIEPIIIGDFMTTAHVEAVIFDFGAISVSYRIPINGTLNKIADLSCKLSDTDALWDHSRTVVENLVGHIKPAISRFRIADAVEDYYIFQVAEFTKPVKTDSLLKEYPLLANILRAELAPLSDQETSDALSQHISYTPHDIAIVDWNAAFVYDNESEESRAVLEFANVASLELRFLDDELDKALDNFYETISKKSGQQLQNARFERIELRKIAQFQVDATVLFESITNSLKLLGDQYMARLYRLASRRFYLNEWNATIARKIDAIEDIYEKIVDLQSTRRSEILDWIIIILISTEIMLGFVLPKFLNTPDKHSQAPNPISAPQHSPLSIEQASR